MQKISKAKIERMAKHARNNCQVNSGALLQADFEDETVEVAQPAAWSHVSPRYEFSAEAPRVYGEDPVTLRVWRSWLLDVIERQRDYEIEQEMYKAYYESFEEE